MTDISQPNDLEACPGDSRVKISDLLSIANDHGKLQKTLFVFLTLLTFTHAIIAYANFYIFYPPDYRCFDSEGGLYPCSESEACAGDNSFVFDDGRRH